jgi:hypothetical protein
MKRTLSPSCGLIIAPTKLPSSLTAMFWRLFQSSYTEWSSGFFWASRVVLRDIKNIDKQGFRKNGKRIDWELEVRN